MCFRTQRRAAVAGRAVGAGGDAGAAVHGRATQAEAASEHGAACSGSAAPQCKAGGRGPNACLPLMQFVATRRSSYRFPFGRRLVLPPPEALGLSYETMLRLDVRLGPDTTLFCFRQRCRSAGSSCCCRTTLPHAVSSLVCSPPCQRRGLRQLELPREAACSDAWCQAANPLCRCARRARGRQRAAWSAWTPSLPAPPSSCRAATASAGSASAPGWPRTGAAQCAAGSSLTSTRT